MDEKELREQQDRYLKACELFGFPDDTLIDCQFPGILVGDLHGNVYPELGEIIRENLTLFPPAIREAVA